MVSGTAILVTGVAGFLGSNLAIRLLERGHVVIGFDSLAYGRLDRVLPLAGARFTFIEGDVRDGAAVRRAVSGVRHIVHLAEVKLPRYGRSLETLEVNVAGTEQVLEAAIEAGAHVILGSTDEVYGKNSELPLNEESALVMGETDVNRWSLGASKLMAEQLCFAYREKHATPITILRYFGGYGFQQDTDWHGGPQSVFVTAALRRESLPIHGDGLQTRTFTHVSDLVAGTVAAIESPYVDGEIINLASRENMSVINLAYLIWRLVGNREKPRFEFVPYTDFSRNYEDVRNRSADTSKAFSLLGFESKVGLTDGMRQTIEWQARALGIEWPGERPQ